MIWTINEQEESGHRRSEDQGLEATMNCAVKNDCKVFSPVNVINRSATVQERETAQKNLKEELFIQYGQKHPSHEKINVERILILRALWRKYFSQVFNFYISSSSEEGASIDMKASAITGLSNQPTSHSPSSLHDKNKSLNVDILKEKELGESAVSNFIDVKVLQRGGWGFSNPPMKEIKTIKGQTNKRRKESMFPTSAKACR